MRFTSLFTVATAAIAVTASPLTVDIDAMSLLGIDLSLGNSYGAPHPPWTPGSHPGWYFGDHGYLYPELTCLEGVSQHSFFVSYWLTDMAASDYLCYP
jgi:hypothetical protein